MSNPGYIALSRQTALMRQMDVVANNLANANTPGFRGEHVLFAEHLSQKSSNMPMSYVEDIAVARDLREGNLTRTDAPLDVAIHGTGYFVVRTPAGDRYSRGGHLQLDDQGQLVTAQGYAVLNPGGEAIRIPGNARDISITPRGAISAEGQQVGALQLVEFENEQALRKTASGLYTTDQPTRPAATAQVMQGMVEESNVQPVIEMTRMMELLRSFQATSTMLEGEHERQLKAIRELPLPPK